MGIIVLLIAISLSIAVIFLLIFYWSMMSGQYDDTYTPSVRMLFENKPAKEAVKPKDELIMKSADPLATKAQRH